MNYAKLALSTMTLDERQSVNRRFISTSELNGGCSIDGITPRSRAGQILLFNLENKYVVGALSYTQPDYYLLSADEFAVMQTIYSDKYGYTPQVISHYSNLFTSENYLGNLPFTDIIDLTINETI